MKLLSQYKGTPIYKHVKDIFDYSNNIKIKSNNNFEKRIIFIEEYFPDFSEETWNILINAIKENRYIEFSYKGAWRKTEGYGYCIAPHQIVSKAGVWILQDIQKDKMPLVYIVYIE